MSIFVLILLVNAALIPFSLPAVFFISSTYSGLCLPDSVLMGSVIFASSLVL